MFVHVVKRGDTIWSIARRYNVSPQRIISDNAIPNPQNLVLGQALLILIPKTVHTVTAGDTLPLIAMAYDTSVLTLMQNNPVLISNPVLVPGQTLVIDFTEEKRRSLVINSYAYPYINQDVLRRALPYLTYLTIFGYGFTLEGDLIEIDVMERKLNIIGIAGERKTAEEIDEILKERRKNWRPREPKYRKGVLRLFSQHAASPMKGAYLDY